MEMEVRVSLSDLKRAFRRLLARLPDETEAGRDFVFFNADGNSLEIVAGGTSEALNATVTHSGHARIPCSVFGGISRTLRFYGGKVITISFATGVKRIDHTDYRRPSISVLVRSGGQATSVTKPAKLQKL